MLHFRELSRTKKGHCMAILNVLPLSAAKSERSIISLRAMKRLS